jgi:hypothetical protein
MLKSYKHIVNKPKVCNIAVNLNLKFTTMIKNLLLTFIAVFAFANMNAQNIVTDSPGCGAVYEHEPAGLVNGKNSYVRLSTTTALGAVYGAIGGNNTVGVRYTGTEWEMYYGGGVLYTNSFAGAGVEAPDTGWVPSGDVCTGGTVLTLYDNNTGVLDVETNQLQDVTVFPNPSSDFISVSNLKEAVQCKITNIAGQVVLSKVLDANDNQMDVQELSKGFYFVEIEGKKTIKFIKK